MTDDEIEKLIERKVDEAIGEARALICKIADTLRRNRKRFTGEPDDPEKPPTRQ